MEKLWLTKMNFSIQEERPQETFIAMVRMWFNFFSGSLRMLLEETRMFIEDVAATLAELCRFEESDTDARTVQILTSAKDVRHKGCIQRRISSTKSEYQLHLSVQGKFNPCGILAIQ